MYDGAEHLGKEHEDDVEIGLVASGSGWIMNIGEEETEKVRGSELEEGKNEGGDKLTNDIKEVVENKPLQESIGSTR